MPFELAIVAGEIGSYKPEHRHWEVFYETTGADRRGHVHVAQSLFHDIEPANELGIPSIWINRLGEPEDPRPTATLTGVGELADALDALVPAVARCELPPRLTSPTVVRLAERALARADLAESDRTNEWTSPRVDLERDARHRGGRIRRSSSDFDDGRVWIERRRDARRRSCSTGRSRGRVSSGRGSSHGAWSPNEPILEELEQRGFGLVRHSHRMMIDLDEPTPEPAWPEGVEVRTFEPGDEKVFYDAASGDVRGLVGADRGAVRRVGALAPERADVRSRRSGSSRSRSAEPAGIAICHPHAAMPDHGWIRILGCETRLATDAGVGRALLLHAFGAVPPPRPDAGRARGRRGEPDGREPAVREGRHARSAQFRHLREGSGVSSLRARCPSCRTFTAVAVGDGYECHSCGSTFCGRPRAGAGCVGCGGEGMAEAARIPLPYPEVAVVERDTLDEQTAAVADVAALATDRPRRVLLHTRRCGASASRAASIGSRSSGSTRTET